MYCHCGQAVYFENQSCTNCGRQLAFDPAAMTMLSEETPGSGLHYCANRFSASRCNWVAGEYTEAGTCISCRSSEVIPALSKAANRERWRKLEAAKRRLIYDLLRLELPIDVSDLRFVFKEDRRTNPNVFEDHVGTGHASGVITINAAEADEVFREQMRQTMNEPYRTLLGHFRHESGHYYFARIVPAADLPAARNLFGDERMNYEAALAAYYENGPPHDWTQRFISSYASAHPIEDWAECWAHYLHIRAVLEVAEETGLRTDVRVENWRSEFIELVLALNEVNRSLGLSDTYPFVLTGVVADKIDFIHAAVNKRRSAASRSELPVG
jgi:hypothetical protein